MTFQEQMEAARDHLQQTLDCLDAASVHLMSIAAMERQLPIWRNVRASVGHADHLLGRVIKTLREDVEYSLELVERGRR